MSPIAWPKPSATIPTTWARAKRSVARKIALLAPIARRQAVTAKPRNMISSAIGAMIAPATSWSGEPGQLAGRRQRARWDDTEDRHEGCAHDERQADDGQGERGAGDDVRERLPVKPAKSHLRPRQCAGADDRQPDDADEDERGQRSRDELADRRRDRRIGRCQHGVEQQPEERPDEVGNRDDGREDEDR